MAAIQIIGARGRVQRPWLFAHIAESRKAGRPVVLYVPEQYTLQAERDLMTGMHLPGLLQTDVISPTRLRSLVRERAGSTGRAPLDETGRAMAIHQALRDCGDELVYYRRLGNLYGAVSRVDRTLSELKEESLTAESLEELSASVRGAARQMKYRDLSRIWREYDALLSDRFDDPVSVWRDLCLRLGPSGLWQGADLYVYGFDTVRPDLRELLLAAAGICASISVLLTMTEASSPSGRIYRAQRDSAARLSAALEEKGFSCRMEYLPSDPSDFQHPLGFLEQRLFSEHDQTWKGDPAPEISLYAAPHPTGEALAIVSALRGWHDSGIAWNRMAIALPKDAAGAETLLAALRRHQIPFFYHQKQSLNRHGAGQLLSAALECAAGGLRTGPLLEIACCGFGALSREEGAHLTEYVRAWGIDRGRWRRPFTRGDNCAEMEELRQRLLAPLDQLHDRLRAAASAEESARAVYLFLQEEGIYPQLQARRQQLLESGQYAEAVVDRQVWNLFMNLLDQLHDLLAGKKISLRAMAALLTGALEQASLSPLPEEEEGVLIGRIGHMLPGRTEALILPGMNEGVLGVRSDSLLSDPERRALEEKTGRALGMDQARMSMIVRSDYVRTMSLPEKRLWVSYCLRDEGGAALLPGEPALEIRRLFPDLRERGGLAAGEDPLPPETPALALEGLGPLLRSLQEGQRAELPSPWPDALRQLIHQPESAPTVQAMLSHLASSAAPRRVSPRTAVRLFHGDRVSISRLETFAACPFQHFLRYGVRPLLPRDFTFSAGDAGNFYHQALQEYIDQAVQAPGWPALPEDRVREIMDAVLDRLTREWADGPLEKDAMGQWQGEEYIRRARHAAFVLTRFAANSDFQVLGTEMEFGTPGGLPPLTLHLPDGADIALQGKIDRLDLYRGPDESYLRVLDLKSSDKRLEPARMASGEQLQLMIYLRSALRSQPGLLPAGALYFPIQDKEVAAPSPEAAESKRLRDVQLKGVALAGEEVLRAMDRDISPYSLPQAINQDGSISKKAPWALPMNTLTGLMDAAENKAAELCQRIREGEISVSPSVSDDKSPCTFCDFRSICPVQKSDERPLPKGLTFEDAAK